ncbi:extracellular solute-binding protein [Anaerosinus sp.]
MRRYIPLLWLTFFILAVVFTSNIYLAGYADKSTKDYANSITVYTSIPIETAALLAAEYEKNTKVKVNFIPLSGNEIVDKVSAEVKEPQADAVLTNKEVLNKIKLSSNALQSYASENTDIISQKFRASDGMWVGVWYDPIVFCTNKDYLSHALHLPTGWEALVKDDHIRIGITDFMAADDAANLYYSMSADFGESAAMNLFRSLHPKIIQYSKFLVTPVRMAGMGEVDVAIAVQSEAMKYVKDGFPIQIIYPEEGSSYSLTGFGILSGTKHKAETVQFMHWLVSDDAQMCLQANKFFFMPTNQESLAYKSFSGKNLILLKNDVNYTKKEKETLLDNWVKNVRFG